MSPPWGIRRAKVTLTWRGSQSSGGSHGAEALAAWTGGECHGAATGRPRGIQPGTGADLHSPRLLLGSRSEAAHLIRKLKDRVECADKRREGLAGGGSHWPRQGGPPWAISQQCAKVAAKSRGGETAGSPDARLPHTQLAFPEHGSHATPSTVLVLGTQPRETPAPQNSHSNGVGDGDEISKICQTRVP